MEDALAGKFGRHARRDNRNQITGWDFIKAIGPVGGSHYLILRLSSDGLGAPLGRAQVIVETETLTRFGFFDDEQDARDIPLKDAEG